MISGYTQQIGHALSVCLPVFSIMGLGWMMRVKGLLDKGRQQFLNQMVYYLALPALIFSAIADQSLENFMHMGFYGTIILSIATLSALYAAGGWVLGLRTARLAFLLVGIFWANVSYMGFPLAQLAYGGPGLQMAAVYNAVAMPLYVILGVGLISILVKGHSSSGWDHIQGLFRNPIILSAMSGLLCVILRRVFPVEDSLLIQLAGKTALNLFKLLGAMGLPLALIVIGASLERGAIKENRALIYSIAAAKLLFLPALAWLLFKEVFVDIPAVAKQTGVLLSAMPSAVSAYVIGVKMGLDARLLSALLAITTGLSIITLPLWLIFLG